MDKVLVIFYIILGVLGSLQAINVGDKLPEFNLESGDCHKLNNNELSGKLVFIFYDTKNTFERNNDFKSDLFKEYRELPEPEQKKIAIMQVIDCADSNILSQFFWKKSLVCYSHKYNLRIWGDWDGGLKQNCNFLTEESYFVITDELGKVIYFQDKQFLSGSIKEITDLVKQVLGAIEAR